MTNTGEIFNVGIRLSVKLTNEERFEGTYWEDNERGLTIEVFAGNELRNNEETKESHKFATYKLMFFPWASIRLVEPAKSVGTHQ